MKLQDANTVEDAAGTRREMAEREGERSRCSSIARRAKPVTISHVTGIFGREVLTERICK